MITFRKTRDDYLALREADPSLMSPVERAARFIYLNRFCFNGLYRTNRAGQFNVPYGGDKAGKLPSREALRACSALLAGTELVSGDFADVLERVQPGDFVYMDPPFSVASRRVFNEYDRSVFGLADLERLRGWLDLFDSLSIRFLVSYAECEEAELLCRGYHSTRVSVRRHIAGFAGSRGRCNEVLISNLPVRES